MSASAPELSTPPSPAAAGARRGSQGGVTEVEAAGEAPAAGESPSPPQKLPSGRKIVSPRASVSGPTTNRRTSLGNASKERVGSLGSTARKSSLGRKLESAREFADGQQAAPAAGSGPEEEEEEGTLRLPCTKLPRGGVYVNTCVGPIQIGIPPGECVLARWWAASLDC